MKRIHRAGVRFGMSLLMISVFLPSSVAQDTGKDLYQARCAECHGKNGEGKSGVKAANLMSERVKGMSDDELKQVISQRTNGEMEKKSSHTRLKKRLTADQVAAVVAHIRTMQNRK
jgi:mono/diheme cytochrome c family protein